MTSSIVFTTTMLNPVVGSMFCDVQSHKFLVYDGSNWNEIHMDQMGGVKFQIELDTGTVYGSRYYTAKPIGWHGMGFDWSDMREFCETTMGPHPDEGAWEPNQRWYMNGERFWFKSEKDRTMFIMRFS